MYCCKLIIVLAVISCPIVFAAPAGLPAPQPSPAAAPATNSLPSKITTTDGVTYNAPKLLRVQPDGLLVEFQPDAGGTGLAKLKFAKLPPSLQKQFGYDPGKASDYEHQQTLAQQSLTQKLQQDDKARSATLILQNEQALRPNLAGAVTVSSADPVVTYTYYTPDQKPALLGSSVAGLEHRFQCRADFDVQVEEGAAGEPVHFSITKVRISLGLTCHIMEPVDPYDIVRQHEECRRKIYEYFYRLSPQVADSIGESMIGKEFTSRDVDFDTAKKQALREAELLVIGQYVVRVESVVHKADLEYDRLTDHGLNNVDRNQASQEACDKFGKDVLNPAILENPEPSN